MKNSRKFRSDIAKKILATVLAGLSLTGGIQNVIAMGPTGNIQKNTLDKNNFWNESAKNSNREFINGYGNNESGILNEIKKFIVNDSVNFDDLKNFGFSSINDLDSSLKDGVKCRIVELKNEENKFRKAIVFILVPDGGTLTKENMNVIKKHLRSRNLLTEDEHYNNDFRNVNFIIRSQSRSNKFEIGRRAIECFHRSTINLQGAKISTEWAISYCEEATINLQGATISAKWAINSGKGAEINLEGAKISTEWAIKYCDKATINLQGAKISTEQAIEDCHGATINLQGAMISSEYAIRGCNEATINLQGATISAKNAIEYCYRATINLERATILASWAIYGCDEATINLERATILASWAIYGCDEATINLERATILERCVICVCKGAKINLKGAKIPRKIIIYKCPDSEITVDEDKACYFKLAVNESENVKINNTLIKGIKPIDAKKYNKNDIELQFNKFEDIGGEYFKIGSAQKIHLDKIRKSE